jgi:ketosteroid isomerase-like protein
MLIVISTYSTANDSVINGNKWKNEGEEPEMSGQTKEELEKLEADWGVAVESNNPDRIGRFVTDDFLFVGAGGVLQTREQHLEDFRLGTLKVDSVKIEQTTTHIYDRSAVVSTRVAVTGKYKGGDIDGSYQFTDTWVKQDRGWLAAARQQTRKR